MFKIILIIYDELCKSVELQHKIILIIIAVLIFNRIYAN